MRRLLILAIGLAGILPAAVLLARVVAWWPSRRAARVALAETLRAE